MTRTALEWTWPVALLVLALLVLAFADSAVSRAAAVVMAVGGVVVLAGSLVARRAARRTSRSR